MKIATFDDTVAT